MKRLLILAALLALPISASAADVGPVAVTAATATGLITGTTTMRRITAIVVTTMPTADGWITDSVTGGNIVAWIPAGTPTGTIELPDRGVWLAGQPYWHGGAGTAAFTIAGQTI